MKKAELDELFLEAVYEGKKEKVIELLNKGADIHAQEDEALMSAANDGNEEMVKELLERGADVHAQDDNALRVATYMGRKEVIKELLDRGADVYARKGEAFLWAAMYEYIEILHLFWQHLEKERTGIKTRRVNNGKAQINGTNKKRES